MKFLLRSLYALEGAEYERELAGLRFKNGVGLAAGLDKNAECMELFRCLGFGFVEIGTVTPMPQPGNEKPRLFRLISDRAIINRMGFNNVGMDVVAERLKIFRRKNEDKGFLIGVNIGKNKTTANEDAASDYLKCYKRLYAVADYFVVNVSSPNTPGLRALQEKDSLLEIFSALQQARPELEREHGKKPIFLKIAPDLNDSQLDEIVELTIEVGIAGLICTNTTISREGLKTAAPKVQAIGAGGLSGMPLKKRSDEVLQYVAQKSAGRLALVGVGGIHQASDAISKMEQGATLVQLYTGLIYEGPALIAKILKQQRGLIR